MSLGNHKQDKTSSARLSSPEQTRTRKVLEQSTIVSVVTFNSITISLLSPVVRLGSDGGEVRRAPSVPVVRSVIPVEPMLAFNLHHPAWQA